MKKMHGAFLLMFGATLLSAGQPARAQTADDIVARNMVARGGLLKLKAVRSVRASGHMMGPGGEAPFVLKWKRPTMYRFEFTVEGKTAIQAYDGKAGWMLLPFTDKKDPEPMAQDDLNEIEEQADFEGPLVDYRKKGNKVELIGKEPVGGTDSYKLRMTRNNGDITLIYIDAKSHLEIKSEGKRMVRGEEIEFETSQSDYKEVGGLLFPHSIGSGLKGEPAMSTFTFDKIDLNVDVPDSEFRMPEVKPDPAKPAQKPEAP
jgi:outer membrane lipoprotein-sorting protein